MKPRTNNSTAVWERTLPHIRMTRRRRQHRRIAAVAASMCALFGSWLAFRPSPAVHEPAAAFVTVEPAPAVETIAVMRIGENGSVRLEELPSSELGAIELAFGLTPLVSDELQDW